MTAVHFGLQIEKNPNQTPTQEQEGQIWAERRSSAAGTDKHI